MKVLFPLADLDCRVDGVGRHPHAVGAIHCDREKSTRWATRAELPRARLRLAAGAAGETSFLLVSELVRLVIVARSRRTEAGLARPARTCPAKFPAPARGRVDDRTEASPRWRRGARPVQLAFPRPTAASCVRQQTGAHRAKNDIHAARARPRRTGALVDDSRRDAGPPRSCARNDGRRARPKELLAAGQGRV